MRIICTDIQGFEDALSLGATYKMEKRGQNGYQVINDKGQQRWYGEFRFKYFRKDV